jgi:hypothetical protein
MFQRQPGALRRYVVVLQRASVGPLPICQPRALNSGKAIVHIHLGKIWKFFQARCQIAFLTPQSFRMFTR